jgi:aminotransferase
MSRQYLNSTVQELSSCLLWDFFNLAKATPGAISLSVGEPDFPTPWHIREEGIYSIEKGRTWYSPSYGLKQLREEICRYYERRLGVSAYDADNCIVTVGVSEAIDLATRAVLDPGDEVIVCDPGYVAYEPSVLLARAVPVRLPLKEEEHFKVTPEALNAVITPKTKMIILNYPSNPTGGIMTRADYEKIIPILKEHHLVIIADEIYIELTYDAKPYSIANFAEIRDQLILVNGFSKAYSMTGWRLGYCLADPDIISAMNNIHQYSVMSPSTISQYAGLEAIAKGDADIETHRESFKARRNYVVAQLNKMGLHTPMPEGAFYVFPNISSTGLKSFEFCTRLLKEAKVAIIPGNAFGPSGEGFARISYAYSLDELKTSLDRIREFLKQFQ